MKRKMMNRDVLRSCFGETSHRSSEVVGNDLVLEAKHKIFLSHSGAQKEFVEHLCKALEDRFHYPFFDRRHESLPKGERFPELIVQAAQQCEMLIVVVSDEYFMSKWPMIELSAFVQAHKLQHESKSSVNGPKILPLFYGLSVGDLEDEGLQKKWFQEWSTLAKSDPRNRIVESDWKYALDVLRTFNGLPYDRNLKEIVAYEELIVSYVCKCVSPDIKWDDSHVQGKSSILKVIGEKVEGVGVSRRYKVKVVGVFGVGGIGKTTTCKTLCNELLSKYEGRVCHIEFPSVSWIDSQDFFQKVLCDLTSKSVDDIHNSNEGECKDILRKSLFKRRTFLAIDNISDSHQSIELAKTLLELPYHMDSLLAVTARSQSVLELLGLDGDACLEMPDLGEADAMRLFLHHAIGGKDFFDDEEKHAIMTCVRWCKFSKGDGQGYHYHPLALKSLGLQLSCHGEIPSLWLNHLPRVRTFNYLSGRNPVFDILRSGFDLLPPRDQTLFMDVGLLYMWYATSRIPFNTWLCAAHKQDEEELIDRLEGLKRKGLLEDVDLRSNKVTMHDLYLEFTKLEAKGSFNDSTNLRERMWVHIDGDDPIELTCKPKGGCWDQLIRLSIKNGGYDVCGPIVGQIGRLEGIKWDYFSNVQVLQLWGVHCGHGALNLGDLVCLRVLNLIYLGDIDRIEGLDKLTNLAYFTWWAYGRSSSITGMGARIVGQLPSSLKLLTIDGLCGVVLGSDLLARCHNLIDLHLKRVEARSLDLSNCWSLEKVSLLEIQKLQTLSGPAARRSSSLRSLKVRDCYDLVDIPGIDQFIGLKELMIDDCPKWEVPSLLALTKLQILNLSGQERLAVCSKDSIPRQLRELHWNFTPLCGGLNLNGFNQLEVLDLSASDGFTSLAEVGDLPALRRLNLGYCRHLMWLPTLSKSRNLQILNLEECSALELHARDIEMLSELPLLQPLPFELKYEDAGQSFRLDLRRGKVLVHPRSLEFWMEDEWEERDLGPPPIKIGKLGPFEVRKEYGTDSD